MICAIARFAAPAAVPVLLIVALGGHAAPSIAGDVVSCAADRPCFRPPVQQGDKIVFQFDIIKDWDFYNVRYAAAGGGEKQVENRSGHYTFNNVKPRSRYTLSVQGCTKHALQHSRCSDWVAASFTTK